MGVLSSQSTWGVLYSQSTLPVNQIQSPVPIRMKAILVLLLTVLSLSHGDPISNPGNDAVDDPMDDTIDDRRGDPEDDFSDIEELEMLAFEQCESDGEEGLTWDEVEECEEIFGPMLTDQGIVLPTEEDFQASDLNKDGILLLREWKEWADMDMAMV